MLSPVVVTGWCLHYHWGWLGGVKVSCILRHRGVWLILAYSWARPAILVAVKGRGGNVFISSISSLSFLFLYLPSPSLSSFLLSLLSLFSLSLGDDTKWPTRVDMSLNPNTINYIITAVPKDGSVWPNRKTGGGDSEKTESLWPNLYWLDVKIFDKSDFIRVCMFLCPQVYFICQFVYCEYIMWMTHTQKQKQEVLDKWLFCLDRLLELSFIKKTINHIMIWCLVLLLSPFNNFTCR